MSRGDKHRDVVIDGSSATFLLVLQMTFYVNAKHKHNRCSHILVRYIIRECRTTKCIFLTNVFYIGVVSSEWRLRSFDRIAPARV